MFAISAGCRSVVGERMTLVESERLGILENVSRHRGRSVSVFGSVARGDDGAHSDVDVLVEFEPGGSRFDLLHVSEELEALLGTPVEVVSVGGLKERDRHIRREAVSRCVVATTSASLTSSK
jgi:hypothetical protein